MTGKTHLGIGVMTTVIASEFVTLNLTLPALLGCAVASLLPDIDHPKSIINKYILPMKNKTVKTVIYFTIGIFIFLINLFYFNYLYVEMLGLFFILIGISSHRNGITHSLVGLLGFVAIVGCAANAYNLTNCTVPFAIGYGLHLLGDMLTARGIPLFYPFSKKKFKAPLTFVVGSRFGNFIEGFIISVGLIYLTWRLPSIIIKMK